ncbi:MAG: hypothetical protein AAGI69_17240 [Cyanobacteria bacterium P01_H01_bin.21]
MWNSQWEDLHNLHSIRIVITQNSSPVSYSAVIHSWQQDITFRNFFIDLLAASPFSAFRWETPAVTTATLDQPFECVLIDSPSLVQPPDQHTFAPYLNSTPLATSFLNLGRDAILVVPRPIETDCDYSHLGAFIHTAPRAQQHALWTLVGTAMAQRISDKPVWLSTAGAGVAWLHVRLDDHPKYYRYAPYRRPYR